MFSYKLISHKNTLLIDHLRNVGNRCSQIIKSKNLNFNYSRDSLIYISKVMGLTHDLGKSTTFFQKYIHEMINNGFSSIDKNLRSHSLISALITYYQLYEFNKDLAIIAFNVVRKHHGNLENLDIELNLDSRAVKKVKQLIDNQMENIDLKELNEILKTFNLKTISKNKILGVIDELENHADDFLFEIEDNNELEKYILFKFLYSTLIFSDKEDAIFHRAKSIEYDISFDVVDIYKSKKFKNNGNSINIVRNSIYNEVVSNINKIDNRIMSITVPTGTGKTLTAFSSALKLRNKLNKNMKIIYCLPFTSIIDQNYEVYSDVIKVVMGNEKITSDRIIKHHYMTEKKYIDEEESYTTNESKFLIENWNSQFIVTTFMQFFNAIFSNINRELVKYNSIANSIVLLDEIQSISHKYWYIINKFFTEMANKLNIYFIFITATQPLIFDRTKGEIEELIPNNEKYFKQFRRTKLHINLEPIEYEIFLEEVKRIIAESVGKSILIILNTVRLAQKLYKNINDMELDNYKTYFLSTGIIPRERKDRIENIKEKKNEKKIVISTQLIEAGVDIDMDVVIRELAPLDCINQSAGRGNREYRGEYLGDVYIFNIVTNNKREYSSFIYDSLLLEKTKKVLEKYANKDNIIYEEDFLKLNNEYFKLIKENMRDADSINLINKLKSLKFKDIREGKHAFKLIETNEKVSVFIEIDDKAKEIFKRWKELIKEKDVNVRFEKFNTFKNDFYAYVITVFKNKLKEEYNGGILHIPYEALDSVYDLEIGYILEDKDIIL